MTPVFIISLEMCKGYVNTKNKIIPLSSFIEQNPYQIRHTQTHTAYTLFWIRLLIPWFRPSRSWEGNRISIPNLKFVSRILDSSLSQTLFIHFHWTGCGSRNPLLGFHYGLYSYIYRIYEPQTCWWYVLCNMCVYKVYVGL